MGLRSSVASNSHTRSTRVRAAKGSAATREARPGLLRRYPQFTISPAIFVALVAAWWLASHVLGAPAYVLPPPEDVLRATVGGLSRSPWDKGGHGSTKGNPGRRIGAAAPTRPPLTAANATASRSSASDRHPPDNR